MTGQPPIHGRRPGGSLLFVAVAALGAELSLLAAAGRGGPVAWLAAGHVLVAAVVGVWAWHPTRRAGRYPALLGVTTASFGPFGPAGLLLAVALEAYYARHATPVDEWHAMLYPPTQVDEQAELWRRIGQRASDRPADQHITPFLDVLAFGTIPQRQSVIAIIAQQFQPAFAPALRAALGDEHNVIRVQAATAIAKLEHEFLERSMKLQEAVRHAPDDSAAALALATHCDEQAFAGLLDAAREQDCRVMAANHYERYLASHPGDGEVRFRLARLQQRRGLWRQAEPLFRQLVDEGHPAARHWLMENLFVQGRYAELRTCAGAQPVEPGGDARPEIAAVMALWAGREASA